MPLEFKKVKIEMVRVQYEENGEIKYANVVHNRVQCNFPLFAPPKDRDISTFAAKIVYFHSNNPLKTKENK